MRTLDTTKRGRRRRSSSWLFAVATWLFAASAAASPIFDSTAANVWLLDSGGVVIGSYNVLGQDWTVDATLAFSTVEVDGELGGNQIVTIPGTLQSGAALINRVQDSDPNLTLTMPSVSIMGLGRPLWDATGFNPNEERKPGVSIDPAADGTFDRTVRVKIKGHDAPFYSPATAPTLQVRYRIDSGSGFGPLETRIDEASFNLIVNGTYTIEYWSWQAGFTSYEWTPGSPETITLTINALDPNRDTDGDGIPDLVEDDFGTDPLVADRDHDRDGDGWSDWEEKLRGTDPDDPGSAPLDGDGDGWADWDEIVRGTDETDLSDFPTATRINEVEYLVDVAFFEDNAKLVPLADNDDFTIMDVFWTPRFESAGPVGTTLMDARVPASEPLILRTRNAPGGAVDERVTRAWLGEEPDVEPDGFEAWLIANSLSWTTPTDWLTHYQAYLADRLVQDRSVDMTPDSGHAIALLDGLVAWLDDLSGDGAVLLGNPNSEASKTAVHALLERMNPHLGSQLDPNPGIVHQDIRTLDELHADLVAVLAPTEVLEPFATTVDGFYLDLMSFSQETTTRAAAVLLQGDEADDDRAARYVSRLLSLYSLADIQALPSFALLLDHTADYDFDGASNESELLGPIELVSDPTNDNTDGDLLLDPWDPCPQGDDNGCLGIEYMVMDSDGDGLEDAIDNCMNDANLDQADANGDAIGDACLRYANIRTPVSNLRLYAGSEVNFTSIDTEIASGNPMTYLWDFGGGATNSTDANPGSVVFNTHGVFQVQFTATDQGSTLPADYRTITVMGQGALPTVSLDDPYVVTEGDPLSMLATALSSNGPITNYDWDFGDGDTDSGAALNSVQHTYAAQGNYTVEVEVTDAFFLLESASAPVAVLDSVPTAAFGYVLDSPFAPAMATFTDLTTAYDGVVGWSWDFDDMGATSTLQDPTYLFNDPGTYQVSLFVIDGDGSTDQVVVEVEVLDETAIPVPGLSLPALLLLGALFAVLGVYALALGRANRGTALKH